MHDGGEPRTVRLLAGELELDLAEGRAFLQGNELRLGGRAFRLLRTLMERGQALSTKNDLINLVWDGSSVSDAVLTTAVREVRQALGDKARNPVYIQTVHGRGYRFLPDVTLAQGHAGIPDAAVSDATVPDDRWGRWLGVALMGALIVLAVYAFMSGKEAARDALMLADASQAQSAAMPDNSVAVLPFLDFSAQRDQGYFGDGIAEELLSLLAKVDALEVASRTSSFSFKSQPERGIPSIARELGVRYVVEGSIRKAGEQIRVTAQLIDATVDKHLWSETYDRTLTAENIFSIQNEIAAAVLEVLEGHLGLPGHTLEASVQAYSDDVVAYEKYLEANALFNARGVKNLTKSISLFEEVVRIEPGFARAWGALAGAAVVAPSWGLVDRDYLALVFEAAEKAIELDPSMALPYAALAHAEGHKPVPDFERMMNLLDEAVARDPRNTSALLWRGVTNQMLGYTDKAIADFEACLAVEPNYYTCRTHLERSYFNTGDFERGYAMWQKNALAGWAGTWPPLAEHFARTENYSALLITTRVFVQSRPKAGDWMIEPLYRAYVDPGYDKKAAYKRVMARLEASGFRPEDDAILMWRLWTAFDVYEEVRPLGHFFSEWGSALPDFAASKHRHRYIQELGLPGYWRKHGFPRGCRPLGQDGFDCR